MGPMDIINTMDVRCTMKSVYRLDNNSKRLLARECPLCPLDNHFAAHGQPLVENIFKLLSDGRNGRGILIVSIGHDQQILFILSNDVS